jgi:hypothetical protein
MRLRFLPIPFLVAAALAAFPVACGSSASDGAIQNLGGNGAGGFQDTTTGAGGGDASIDISPDAGHDPTKTFAELCGTGVCAPGGSPDGCGIQPVNDGAPPGPQTQACGLVAAKSGAYPVCGPVGASLADQPCQTVADCAAGLGCVQTANGGACRPYCCADVEACPDKTYCAPQPMAEDDKTQIPVCVPTDNCTLLPDAQTCPAMQTPPAPGCCADGLACFIVRSDGSTSCLTPGASGLGGTCPCQAGFVCSKLTDECKKLCRLGHDAADCPGGGKCEGGSMAYPAGFGVCVAGNTKSY